MQALGGCLVSLNRYAGERSWPHQNAQLPLLAICRNVSSVAAVSRRAEVQAAGIFGAQNRGFDTVIGPAGGLLLTRLPGHTVDSVLPSARPGR